MQYAWHLTHTNGTFSAVGASRLGNESTVYLHSQKNLQPGYKQGGGHWAMASPSGAECTICDCSALSNRECVYRENVHSWRATERPPMTKSSFAKSFHVFIRKM